MKKITLLLVLTTTFGFSQVKSTGVITLNTNMTAKLDLDQATTTATLTITNPSASWFGFGFSNTNLTVEGGMPSSVDCVVMRSATNLSDSMTTGPANPTIDPIQNWTIVTNSVSGSTRTLVATRPFNTGDANDLVFNFANNSMTFIFASPNSGNFGVSYHGGQPNRGIVNNVSLATLGSEDFSLKTANLYPNPSKGLFTVDTKTELSEINIYSHVGQFVRTIKVENTLSTSINLSDLQTGVYLLELKNESDKSWKKIVIE